MKRFLIKAKYFIKRNIYPITVTFCTALMIGIIAISAYTSIQSSKEEQTIIGTNSGNNENKNENKDNGTNSDAGGSSQIPEKPNDSEQASTPDPIIFDLPFENATISKEYADDKLLYDETTKFWCTHQGLDFACSEGQSVVAVFDGKIKKIENSMMNGTVIYIEVSENLMVVYKGLSSDVSVKEGDNVKKGQVIGKVTSMLSEKADGIHLHLELLKDNVLINPTEYFSIGK